MRRVCGLLIALLMLPVFVAAQGPAGAGAGGGSQPGPGSFSRPELTQWQVAIGFQYNRINLLGQPFNTEGLNVTVTRYFGRWFGVDGQVGTGFFGDTGTSSNPPNLGVHTVFVGGGPRLAYRSNSRVEPWVHAVAGLQDFRFTQTAGLLGSNSGLGGAAGGGADFLVGQHWAVRVEADTMETHFFSTYQRHFQMVSGLVFNF